MSGKIKLASRILGVRVPDTFYTTTNLTDMVAVDINEYKKNKTTDLVSLETNKFMRWSGVNVELLSIDQLRIMLATCQGHIASQTAEGKAANSWITVIIHRLEQLQTRRDRSTEKTRYWWSVGFTIFTIIASIAASWYSINLSREDGRTDLIWQEKQAEQNELLLSKLEELKVKMGSIPLTDLGDIEKLLVEIKVELQKDNK